MREINKIIVHCSATKEGQPVTVEQIDQWHREKGCKEIGYHFVVYEDGSIHIGRAVEKPGAHCIGQNQNSIGICYIGGLDGEGKPKDTRSDAQKKSLCDLVSTIQHVYPFATVHGHREFAKKACPCFDVRKEFK